MCASRDMVYITMHRMNSIKIIPQFSEFENEARQG